ncbi:MAG: sigma-70 family RNA polymerase sigma factor [Verrucomicrobia bacterium]|nr:sigma-70 family RNA polymerase sigma factor [Verrucomicrobiota bacterium]
MSVTFDTTQWTVIFQAGDAESPDGSVAFGKLCRSYWQPMYAFTRGSGTSHENAQDLTQSFFQYLLQNQLPAGVHPAKGRFRSWMLAVFKNFLAAEHRHDTRQKRGGPDLQTITLEDAHHELIDPSTPAREFEREWARSVLANALERLRVECDHAGQMNRFTLLQESLFDLTKGEGASAEQAAALGISLNAAKIALSRLRQRYRELLRKEVSRLVEDPAEVDDEISHLVRVLTQ